MIHENKTVQKLGTLRPDGSHRHTLVNGYTSNARFAPGGARIFYGGPGSHGWTALWKVVTDYPDEPVAADAVSALLADGRSRDARALADQMSKLVTPLAETQVADKVYSFAGHVFLGTHSCG